MTTRLAKASTYPDVKEWDRVAISVIWCHAESDQYKSACVQITPKLIKGPASAACKFLVNLGCAFPAKSYAR